MWNHSLRCVAPWVSVFVLGAFVCLAIWHDWHWNNECAGPISSISVVHLAVCWIVLRHIWPIR